MILDFKGGVRPVDRTRFGKRKIEYINDVSAICIKTNEKSRTYLDSGVEVLRGTLLGETEGTPVFSSIAGVYNGIVEIEDELYFAVINKGQSGEEIPFEPESRSLSDLSHEDIVTVARKFGIIDTRSGQPLWRLIEKAKGCRRIVIDCTETDAKSAIKYRLCLEKARSAVGGAKVLLKATGALKCVFAAEFYRKAAFSALSEFASDEKLFAMAELNEKYPYSDEALMSAIYLKDLKNGETPIDAGVLIVGIETAIALFDSMVSGMPFVDRYISLCGRGIEHGGNFKVPRGITVRDVSSLCGQIKSGYILIENSLLSGFTAKGAVDDRTSAIISVFPERKKTTECISCLKCIEVCPVSLNPSDVLFESPRKLRKDCISCGCCEFVCPSGIPLLSLINRRELKNSVSETPEVFL